MNRYARSSNRGRDGSALLVVMLMLGVVAILAAAVARSVSTAAFELSAARATAESESDLRAGIELGVAAILKLGDDMRSAEASADLRGRRITVRVTNERARIDLNTATADVLSGLLKSAGFDDNESAALAANIVAWRGSGADDKPAGPLEDDRHFGVPQSVSFDTPIGAASKQAQAKTPSVNVFVHPVQLVSVPGFSRNLVRRLFPDLTVANGANKINPFIAGPGVLGALPGATPDSVEAFLDARDGNVSRETAIQLLGVDRKLLSDDAAGGWRLQITSMRADRVHHSEAIVAGVNSDGDQPYGVLYVLDDVDKAQY
jgi:general secretion pathway protein K